MTALALIVVYLLIHFLREYKLIFQPLLVAVFISYLIMPLHHWLVQRSVPALLAYVLILFFVLGILFVVGALVFNSCARIVDRLPVYEEALDKVYQQVLETFNVDGWEKMHLADLEFVKEMGSMNQMMNRLRDALGRFIDLFSGMAITFVYLIFLAAERESLHGRLAKAFGQQRAQQVFTVAGTINRAITQYLSVKTFMGFLAAMLSIIVLAGFRVDFFFLWGVLIFLLNYIPYIGSLAALIPPIALSFLQLEVWQGLLVTGILILIQQVTGTFLEPRMAGRRLDVSPLLILLSLSFWGLIWGIVGMILAVPLLVAIKTVLENIDATKPLATMLSNQQS
jgi:AI-2 transport protein TqsA